MMTALVATLVAATGPAWAQRTVTWSNSTVSSIEIMTIPSSNPVFSSLGIEATVLHNAEWAGATLAVDAGDTLRLVSTIGKITSVVFYSRDIQINVPLTDTLSLAATGWSVTDSTYVWSGTPSDTVILTMIESERLLIKEMDSLVFTLEMPSYTLSNIPIGWTVAADGNAVSVTNGEALIKEGAVVILTPSVSAMDSVKNVTLTDPGAINQLMINISGVNFFYLEGETWEQAITNHAAVNSGWALSGDAVHYDSYVLLRDGSYNVLKSDSINPSLDYSL